MRGLSQKLSLLLAVLALTATDWCGRSAYADVQAKIAEIEGSNEENKPDRADRITDYLNELTSNTDWTNSERLALIRKLAEHLRYLSPLHGTTIFPMDTELWKDLLEEGFEGASDDRHICYSLCQIYINEQDYAAALPVAEAFARIRPGGYDQHAAPAFLEWCRARMGSDQRVSQPVFDLHFVVITANTNAHAAMTDSKCRSAVYHLAQEFRSLAGEQLANFRFKSLTTYDVASTTECDDILAYGDIVQEGQWNFNSFCSAVNACTDTRMRDPNAINCYIFDQGGLTDHDGNANTPKIWTLGSTCCHGRSNNYKPIIAFDWARLISRTMAPEAHEMGHGFGLDHVAIPGSPRTNSTNIMGHSEVGFRGSGGLRNTGFTEAQVAIIAHSARNIHAAPFGVVVSDLVGRNTHAARSSYEITFYLQNLGSGVGTVRAFSNGTLLRSFHNLRESQEQTLTVSFGSRVILKAYSGSMYDEEIVHFDRNPPTFERIDVFPNSDPTVQPSVVLSAAGIRDDGYWNSSDYQVHVTLDGTVLPPRQGIIVKPERLSVGQHHAIMRIADGTGKLSEARSVTFNVDNLGPSLTVLSPAENATVRPGSKLQITIEAGAAEGIQTVKLFLDRISEDEFDHTSLGVFPGIFGVDTPERRGTVVTANWTIGSHKLIAVATDNSGATTTVERTFRVSQTLLNGSLPRPLPRQWRYNSDTLKILSSRYGRDGQSRRESSGSTSQMRYQPTHILPTRQGNSTGPRFSFDQHKLQPINGASRTRTEPQKIRTSGNGGVQNIYSSRILSAALLEATETPSDSKNKQKAKAKVGQEQDRKYRSIFPKGGK